jgi:dTMP kinase
LLIEGNVVSLIAIEGIDRSGKRTHSMLLLERLRKIGRRVEHITFPDYKTPLGKEINKFLRGRIKFRPEIRQLLYVANRWERAKDICNWLKEGKIVIADRYIPSGIAYGLANNLELEWMLKLERGLPIADVVIVIDIPVDTAHRREKAKDLYEEDELFQDRVRKAYLNLAKQFGWKVIDGKGSIKEIAEHIWSYISKTV